jgi:hypothetical protein
MMTARPLIAVLILGVLAVFGVSEEFRKARLSFEKREFLETTLKYRFHSIKFSERRQAASFFGGQNVTLFKVSADDAASLNKRCLRNVQRPTLGQVQEVHASEREREQGYLPPVDWSHGIACLLWEADEGNGKRTLVTLFENELTVAEFF